MKIHLTTLLVEDDLVASTLLEAYLGELESFFFTISKAETLNLALLALSRNSFDLILLDLNLPDSRGLNTIKIIQQYDRKNTPILPITGTEISQQDLDDLGLRVALSKNDLTPRNLDTDIQIALHSLILRKKNLILQQQAETLKANTALLNRKDNYVQRATDPTSSSTKYNYQSDREP